MDTTPRLTNLTKRLSAAKGVHYKDFLTVLNGSADMVYLANRKSRRRHVLFERRVPARRGAAHPRGGRGAVPPAQPGRRRAQAHPGAVHPGWRLDGPRTGDLFVTDRSGGAFAEPDNELVGNHGGPQTRDNFFAVVGGGAQVRQGLPAGKRGPLFDDTLINPRRAENVDPAPTVMGLLGLAPPRRQPRALPVGVGRRSGAAGRRRARRTAHHPCQGAPGQAARPLVPAGEAAPRAGHRRPAPVGLAVRPLGDRRRNGAPSAEQAQHRRAQADHVAASRDHRALRGLPPGGQRRTGPDRTVSINDHEPRPTPRA